MIPNKIFIIGLPRTATTSVCVAMLHLGFKTAHTAYTQKAMFEAQAIADTPIFCDYQALDKQYENAKFIYLDRPIAAWLPSIKQLLQRMYHNLQRPDGGFNIHLKRCFNEVFTPLTLENINDDTFLTRCYNNHKQQVFEYFKERQSDLLIINVAQPSSFNALLDFVEIPTKQAGIQGFELINMAGKVTAWNDIKHPLKIASTNNGKIDKHL